MLVVAIGPPKFPAELEQVLVVVLVVVVVVVVVGVVVGLEVVVVVVVVLLLIPLIFVNVSCGSASAAPIVTTTVFGLHEGIGEF